MTIKKFFILAVVQMVVFTFLKVWFYKTTDFYSTNWQFFYWAVTAVIAAFLARALGVMNYLEAMFIALVWVILDLLADALVTLPVSGVMIFSTMSLWVGYGFMMIFEFAFHKKRHVAIRHGQWHDPHHH